MSARARPFDRLLERLRREHNFTFPPLVLRRTYAGFWQRSAGAWSWVAEDSGHVEYFASHWPVMTLLRAKRIGVSRAWGFRLGTAYELDPENDGGSTPVPPKLRSRSPEHGRPADSSNYTGRQSES